MTLNPKVGVFFVAVVPQFVAPGPGASLRVALLLVVYGALCLVFWTGSWTACTAPASSCGARACAPGRSASRAAR